MLAAHRITPQSGTQLGQRLPAGFFGRFPARPLAPPHCTTADKGATCKRRERPSVDNYGAYWCYWTGETI